MSDPLRNFEALVAVVLLLEALHQVGVFTDVRIRVRSAIWLIGVLLAGWAGYVAFSESLVFFPWFAVLLVIQAARYRSGLLKPAAGLLDRWRYLLPISLIVLFDAQNLAALAFLILFLTRRNVRFVLIRIASSPLPSGLHVSDVDHIVPKPVRIEKEKGMSLVEVVVAMTLLVTICSTIYLAAANRALRLTQVREAQAARETAVTVIETALADDFEDLRARDGETFAVPGGSEPGTLRVALVEEGLLEVAVTVPRRGRTPIEIATFRSGRADR